MPPHEGGRAGANGRRPWPVRLRGGAAANIRQHVQVRAAPTTNPNGPQAASGGGPAWERATPSEAASEASDK
eukprot:11245925-Alexandrium_andersonii.AAC.1